MNRYYVSFAKESFGSVLVEAKNEKDAIDIVVSMKENVDWDSEYFNVTDVELD